MSRNHINVLLPSIGGVTPRALARSLKSYAKCAEYRIVGTDCNRTARGLYDADLIDAGYLIPAFGETQYWDCVNDIVRREGIDVALVQGEEEVEGWAACVDEGKPIPCPTALPPHALVNAARNKNRMNELLANTDLIPHSRVIHSTDTDEVIALCADLGYPYWVRAAKGSSGLGSFKISSPDQLRMWLAINDSVNVFTASEFLPGRNLASLCLYNDGTLLKVACAERLEYVMAKVAPSGVTGNTSFGRLINDVQAARVAVDGLTILAQRLCVKPHGLLTVDLKEDEHGTPKITEINVRHVAFTSAFSAAGLNLAESTALLGLGLLEREGETVHQFSEDWVFLRDVDALPLVIRAGELLDQFFACRTT